MKKVLLFIITACTIETQLELIRPGASWQIISGDYDGIVWLDKVQTKPTRSEMDQAFIDCQAQREASLKDPGKEAAKTIFDNKASADAERIDAIVQFLGI